MVDEINDALAQSVLADEIKLQMPGDIFLC